MTAALLSWWGHLKQPTLQRRSVAYVLAGFVVIWLVLLAYVYYENRRIIASEQPLLKWSQAWLDSIEPFDDPREAAAAVRSTLDWVNTRRAQVGRFPIGVDAQLIDARGQRVLDPPRLQAVPEAAWQAPPDAIYMMGTQPYRLQVVQGARWTLRVADPVRTTERFLSYNATFLLPYLLLALPFVLVPVWWSVRSGLQPLAQFAQALHGRRQGDLRPVNHPVRHSELKPLADALEGLLAQLRQRFDRERVFVQDAAHEIRTPLAVVGTQAHVLAHAQTQDERLRAQALLNQAIARASHLAQQLLMLATLDSDAPAASRHIDVAQALRVLMAQLAPLAMERGIELSLDAPDQLGSAVDEPALESIVVNLLDNAIRYGREGGSIAVVLRGDAERLSLQVRDDGPGIPESERARVFERFYRVAGTERNGSGLGLAIVQRAASRMGGHVAITDGLAGAGVGFLVSLPVPGFRAE